MARAQRCLVLLHSRPRFCPICHGAGLIEITAIPDGAPVPAPCLHCTSTDHLPIAYLPAYNDRKIA